MSNFTVSVVIPVYNEEKHIEKCLESLMLQTVKPNEIIVVNNNSTDKTVETVKKFKVILINEEKKGITPARNAGFNKAKSDIIARTDGDTRLPPYWIAKIKENLENSDILAVSGPAYYFDLPRGMKISYWSTSIFFKFLKRKIKTDCLFGPNMAIKKTAWEKVKGDTCLVDKLVHEDIDLAIHLSKYGRIKFDSKMIVATSAERWKKPYSYLEYSYRLAKMLRRHNIKI